MNADGSGRPRQVNIDVTADYRFDPVESKTYTSNLSEYALSPGNQYLALVIRGEMFVTPTDEDRKRSTRQTKSPFRDQEIAWLNDSSLLFISDRNGNNDLFFLTSTDAEESDLFRTFKREVKPLTQSPEDEDNFVLSPDRKRINFQRGRGQLIVADIDENGALSNQQTLLDGWATPGNIAWSPDGQWLAYDMPDLNFNREIYIHAADGSQDPVNVSLHPRGDSDPVWSADGSKLGFISNRNNADDDVWFVWLKKEDWEKNQRDWEELENNGEKENNAKKDSTGTLTVEIDFEDIHERLAQVTRLPGNEGDLAISPDGETFYFSTNNGGRQGRAGKSSFMSVKWDGSESKTLIDDQPIGSLRWDKAGKKIYFASRGTLARLNLGNNKVERLPFQATMEIDHLAERRQIFDEAWRAMQAGFYDPNFHGRDWEALRDRYEERALAASTAQDFRDMFNEMLGQLNASHMGMYGSNPEETQRDRTGLLGVELQPLDRGVEITAVLPESPARWSGNPLSERSSLPVGTASSTAPTSGCLSGPGTSKRPVKIWSTGQPSPTSLSRIRRQAKPKEKTPN